jgi:hypothetical protein
MTTPRETGPRDKSWFERNDRVLFWALVGTCLALLAAGPFYEHHAYFVIDGWPGFYAVFGFVAFVFIVYAGKGLRRLIMRDEDYYDRR